MSDEDLLLSKLMRDDPLDAEDALFICSAARFTESQVRAVLGEARIPDVPALKDEFEQASRKLLAWLSLS